MNIQEQHREGGWINAFAISLAIWVGVIAGLSLL